MEWIILSTALLVGDWGQTRYISTHDRYTELNFAIGKNPSLKRVNIYFAAAITANVTIGLLLPEKKRAIFGKAVSGMQASFFLHNKTAGIGFNYEI